MQKFQFIQYYFIHARQINNKNLHASQIKKKIQIAAGVGHLRSRGRKASASSSRASWEAAAGASVAGRGGRRPRSPDRRWGEGGRRRRIGAARGWRGQPATGGGAARALGRGRALPAARRPSSLLPRHPGLHERESERERRENDFSFLPRVFRSEMWLTG
uniref:Uncharacterized protein n=1 Tax=Oryza brachyantha TaxID=4533 RepID=J3KY51_ORYBR